MRRNPARKRVNCLGIETKKAADLEARQLTGFGAVVHPRAADFEVASDVLRIPKRFTAIWLILHSIHHQEN